MLCGIESKLQNMSTTCFSRLKSERHLDQNTCEIFVLFSTHIDVAMVLLLVDRAHYGSNPQDCVMQSSSQTKSLKRMTDRGNGHADRDRQSG